MERIEKQDSSGEGSGEGGSENRESESVKLRLAFEMENYAVHYICAFKNYQRTTAAKNAENMYVVEMVMDFGGWERHA